MTKPGRDDGWTIAYRRRRANRFHRVANWHGTWYQARELARTFVEAHPDLDVYYVSTAAAEASGRVCAEDQRNILVDSGRRVPMFETGVLPPQILEQVPDAAEAEARFGAPSKRPRQVRFVTPYLTGDTA